MTPRAVVSSEHPTRLDDGELDAFAELGYLVIPGFLPRNLVSRLEPEVDRWVDEGLRTQSIASATDPRADGPPPMLELEMPAHGDLATHPGLLSLIGQLMGTDFAFHHLHSDRHAPDIAGKPWHHDYEQPQQSERTFLMLHALHYLSGIEDGSASLVVLPGSHRQVAEKDALAHRGTDHLAGEVLIDRLPPGSTVLLHSAVFHARRVKRLGQAGPRYFVDASYCQAGVRWLPVKPHWRYILRRAWELGLDRGQWPELFAERHFSEYVPPRVREQG